MKIFKKFLNKKKTVKQNIYNMKFNCPHCSSGDFYLAQLWLHTHKEHPDKLIIQCYETVVQSCAFNIEFRI